MTGSAFTPAVAVAGVGRELPAGGATTRACCARWTCDERPNLMECKGCRGGPVRSGYAMLGRVSAETGYKLASSSQVSNCVWVSRSCRAWCLIPSAWRLFGRALALVESGRSEPAPSWDKCSLKPGLLPFLQPLFLVIVNLSILLTPIVGLRF